jgi:catechol-2,3-dioxygenase
MLPAVRLIFTEFSSTAPERLVSHYRDVLGLRVSDASGDTTYLTLGAEHHNFVVTRAAAHGMKVLGLQTDPAITPAELVRHLTGKGIAAAIKSDARPGVRQLVECTDPSGLTVQLFPDMAMSGPGFGTSGIAPIRFGHVAMMSSEGTAAIRFYSEVLGFQNTDWFEDLACFLTCNQDHHVLNIINAPGAPFRAHHIAWQLTDRAHHVTAADRLFSHGIPVEWGPSRHTAGHNLATYYYDPDKLLVELYSDMDVWVPALGFCEPRPWHDQKPLRPRHWSLRDMSTWETKYEFDFSKA